MRAQVRWMIAPVVIKQLGASATPADRAAYCAYLAASLPSEAEADEIKYLFEEAWDDAIRDWHRLIGPFYSN